MLPRTGALAYEQLLIEAGIPDIFMAVSNCTHQLQQSGSRFPFRAMVYGCFQNKIFLEFFVHGQFGKFRLWSETPLSGLPFSHTFSANGEAQPGQFFLKLLLQSSTFSCFLLLHVPIVPCTPSCLCFVLVRHPGTISPEAPISISLHFLTQEVVLHLHFPA